MANTYSLKAEERDSVGTGSARALRRNNTVPAIIYGAGKQQILCAVSQKEITMQYHKNGFMSHMFDIEVGKKKYRALPKSVQLHPVTDNILHVDFVHVDAKEKIKINVTLHFINEDKCPGIKQGGVLNIVRHDLEIYCLPSNIPESINIDVANLAIGQNIHVRDIALPEGVETKVDLDVTVAAMASGKIAVEETPAEEAVAAAAPAETDK